MRMTELENMKEFMLRLVEVGWDLLGPFPSPHRSPTGCITVRLIKEEEFCRKDKILSNLGRSRKQRVSQAVSLSPVWVTRAM